MAQKVTKGQDQVSGDRDGGGSQAGGQLWDWGLFFFLSDRPSLEGQHSSCLSQNCGSVEALYSTWVWML